MPTAGTAAGCFNATMEFNMAVNLTSKRIAQLRKTPGRYRDSEVRGLMLVVNSPTSANWTLRYEFNGVERWMGLGGVRDVPLSKARERAREMRLRLVLDKVDPLAQRREERAARKVASLKAMTFRQCAEAFILAHAGKWRNAKHGAQWTNSLRDYAFPILGDLPVAEIDTALILKTLEQSVEADGRYGAGSLWVARRETASRLRGRIESILGWSQVRGFRTGDNPARWRGHLATVLPSRPVAQEHFAALPWQEVPAFVSELRTREGVPERALEFAILTAARTGEVLGARWDEIDLTEAVWTIPPARTKSQREHRVPLSPAAITLLRSLYVEHDNPHSFIGSGGGALAQDAMRRLPRQLGKACTVHGFRSAFRDWAGEQTSYAHDVCEAALAHSRGAVHAAYQRGDLLTKRRRLMTEWASYIETPVKAGGDVVPIRAS
jgi:integrase